MISLHVDDSVVMVVTNVTSHVQRSCEAQVVICLSHFPEYFFGSDRSPRRGDLVCASVGVLLSSNNEF